MVTFEQRLIQKYPNLFYEKQGGELDCPCGVWVPVGWEPIVDVLCGSINHYVTNTARYSHRIISKWYYPWHYCAGSLIWLHQKCKQYVSSLDVADINQGWYSFIEIFNKRARQYIEYTSKRPPEVKIDQIKEKFGELRFYISGGDDYVAGMIQFAEYMCAKTCEVTGQSGELCIRGGWLKTLSADIILQPGYIGYKPVEKERKQD